MASSQEKANGLKIWDPERPEVPFPEQKTSLMSEKYFAKRLRGGIKKYLYSQERKKPLKYLSLKS